MAFFVRNARTSSASVFAGALACLQMDASLRQLCFFGLQAVKNEYVECTPPCLAARLIRLVLDPRVYVNGHGHGQVSGGKQYAKRATMWDAVFVGIGTMSRRDEGLASIIARCDGLYSRLCSRRCFVRVERTQVHTVSCGRGTSGLNSVSRVRRCTANRPMTSGQSNTRGAHTPKSPTEALHGSTHRLRTDSLRIPVPCVTARPSPSFTVPRSASPPPPGSPSSLWLT